MQEDLFLPFQGGVQQPPQAAVSVVGYDRSMSDNPHTLAMIKKLVELADRFRKDPESDHMRPPSYGYMSDQDLAIEREGALVMFMGTILAGNGQPIQVNEREAVFWDSSVDPDDDLETQEFDFYSLVLEGVEFDLDGNVGAERVANNIHSKVDHPLLMYSMGDPFDMTPGLSLKVLPLIGTTQSFRDRISKETIGLFINERAHALDENTEPARLESSSRPRI